MYSEILFCYRLKAVTPHFIYLGSYRSKYASGLANRTSILKQSHCKHPSVDERQIRENRKRNPYLGATSYINYVERPKFMQWISHVQIERHLLNHLTVRCSPARKLRS